MKHDKSLALFERAKTLMPGGVNSPVRAFRSVDADPFIVSHAQGPWLHDVDGNRYVDFINSWGPLVLGHAHPSVVAAITKQAALGTSYGACCELESQLAELVMRLVPSIEMIRFVNSGTEAGMSVLRLARGFTKRNKILKFSGCYHGHTDSLLVQAGSGMATLGLPDCAGVPEQFARDTLTAKFNDLSGVVGIFEAVGPEIAAVIVEPVVGNAGFIRPQSDFLAGLRDVTHKFGSLLIFDEVMTGFRVGLGGAQGRFGVTPDLTMLGKVIGGGLPVGAFGGRREVMQQLAPLGPVYQAGTLSGNPLAMVAGLTTLQEWSKPGVFEETSSLARRLVERMRELAEVKKIPFCADVEGTMFGYFFQDGPVRNYEEAKNSNLATFKRFFHGCLEQGVYFAPSQFEAGFISQAHRGEAFEMALSVLAKVFATL